MDSRSFLSIINITKRFAEMYNEIIGKESDTANERQRSDDDVVSLTTSGADATTNPTKYWVHIKSAMFVVTVLSQPSSKWLTDMSTTRDF